MRYQHPALTLLLSQDKLARLSQKKFSGKLDVDGYKTERAVKDDPEAFHLSKQKNGVVTYQNGKTMRRGK
jgi:hypothetical protein